METAVGAQSLSPLAPVTLSSCFPLITEMVQEVVMVPQLQSPAAPIHMDPVQALGLTLHQPSKKIHYVLGGGWKGRLVLGESSGREQGAWLG